MKKNLKKISALILTLALLISLVACGGGKDDEAVTVIKWVQVGSGMPTNYEAWKEHINPYIEEKIGVHLDVEVISWGDWESRRSVIVNTNEPYDILFTNLDTYIDDVNLGAFADISDLVKNEAPDLYNLIPESYWEASKVNGKIYAVPTYKDSSVTNYFVWDKELANKYNPDYKNLNTLESLTDTLRKMKEGEGQASFILHQEGLPHVFTPYDSMGSGLPIMGVRYDDQSYKVVNVLEEEDMRSAFETLHTWYSEGIINSDAATLAEAPKYRPCFVAQGWSMAAETVWGPQMGVEADAVQWGDTVVSNDSVRGSLSCISASSNHQKEAVKLLELVNTDSKLRDALFYGLEGDDFEYTEDGRIKRLKTDWPMAGYTQGTFFVVSQLEDVEKNQWDEVKALNQAAKPSVLLGFTFNTEAVEDELTNCIEIYNRYKRELLTGTQPADSIIEQMTNELNKAGFTKVMEEAQKQVDDFAK